MQDEEVALLNGCTELVSLRKVEAFPRRLLEEMRAGEWVRVRDFCSQAGVAAGEFKPELFATWLPDPMADEAYAVILFYDDESKWSMAAHYNRGRLRGDSSPQPIRAASPASSGSTPPQAAPTAELQHWLGVVIDGRRLGITDYTERRVMLRDDEIRRALRAERVVPVNVSNPHGPLGLEQLARAKGEAAARPVTAAELAAAVVEQFVATVGGQTVGRAG